MEIMKESELFAYLQKEHYPDLVKSEGTYDSFDCISEMAGHYIELKCRRTHYPTLLIEQMKYAHLIQHSAERDLLPFYINSTPQGIYSFDLTEIPQPEWVVHWMPVVTDFGNRGKKEKLVGYLDIKDAIEI